MKEYIIFKEYRGGSFNFYCCAKSRTEASIILDVPLNRLKNWGFIRAIKEPYEGTFVEAYGGQSSYDIGHKNKIPWQEAKQIVDKCADERYEQYKLKYNL